MFKVIYQITFLVLIVCLPAVSQEAGYQPVTKFVPERNAEQDLAMAIKEAEKSNKTILLDVGGEWCIWCHRIDEFIESDKEIKNFLDKNYVVLKINYSKENKNEDFLSKYPKIEGYPHFFVLNKEGRLIHSQNTGELEHEKSYSKEKMMSFLKKWAPAKK